VNRRKLQDKTIDELAESFVGKPQITAKLVQQLAVATGAPFLMRSSSARTIARMSCDKLRNLTSEELVQRFVEIGLAQDEALVYGEIAKFNRLFGQKDDVVQELRGGRAISGELC
jgi:hypothetical protein